ncbi:MAG: AN1-type zinc finger protein [Nitrosopumilaceae archaeon]
MNCSYTDCNTLLVFPDSFTCKFCKQKFCAKHIQLEKLSETVKNQKHFYYRKHLKLGLQNIVFGYIFMILLLSGNLLSFSSGVLYYDHTTAISFEYPKEWITDDRFSNDEQKLVYLLYFDQEHLPKADITGLTPKEFVLDYNEILYGAILIQKPTSFEPQKSEDDYFEKLFTTQKNDCKLLDFFNYQYTCDNLVLIDEKMLELGENTQYQITYSWFENYELCEISDYTGYKCTNKTKKNISIAYDIITDDQVWRVNSKFTEEKFNELSDELDKIINSLQFIDKETKTDKQIPIWIKNNALWWSEGNIDDSEFVQGIQYLINNYIIDLPESSEEKINSYTLPKSGSLVVGLNGHISNFTGSKIVLTIEKPDGTIQKIIPKMDNQGNYLTHLTLDRNSPTGEYRIFAKQAENELKYSIIVKKMDSNEVPNWVRNNAKWWAQNQISENEFLSAMQFLVKENIIKLEKKDTYSIVNNIDHDLLTYETKLFSHDDLFDVVLVKATKNDICSLDEKRAAREYAIVSEYMLKKNLRQELTHVVGVCTKIEQIKQSTYPLVLSKLGIQKPDLLIFVGNVDVNFETYYDYGAYGSWACVPVYDSKLTQGECRQHIIVICECDKRYENVKDGSVWTLSHEISHYMLYEQRFSPRDYGDNVHWIEYLYNECREKNLLESKDCLKLYQKVNIEEEYYNIMNIDYLKTNWREIANQVKQEILQFRGY